MFSKSVTVRQCCSCACTSSTTHTEYMLINRLWRVRVVADVTGREATQWFCPSCWVKRKSGPVDPKPVLE